MPVRQTCNATSRSKAARWVAALALAVLTGPTLPAPAAAGSQLRVEADATWVLQAGDTAVRATVTFTLTNLVPDQVLDDGSVRHHFFDTVRPGLPREATNVRAESDGVPLEVITVDSDPPDGDGPSQRSAVISLREPLFYQQTQTVTLRFDLPGSPPRSEGRVRINPAYATFDAHAWGDPGLASVEVRVADIYDVSTGGATVPGVSRGEFTVFEERGIADPAAWYLHVSARNDAALDVVEADVPDLAVTVRSWPGDTLWATRLRELAEAGLPYLRERIGLEYRPVERVAIFQARDPSLLGFAGWYLADQDRIEMGEDVDEHVVLHELSHLWFNSRLFAERWVNEGMAEVFAADAVLGLGYEPDPRHVPRRPVWGDPARVPLNDWTFPEVAPSRDPGVREREIYGYAASYWVVDAIAAEIGFEGLAAVIGAASRAETAHPAPGTPVDRADDPRTDWRRLLDLLEEHAGSTVAADLFRDHVANAEQQDLLDERSEARRAYAPLREADPPPPWAIRRLLDAWAFSEAHKAMGVGAEILDLAASTGQLASDLGLETPRALLLAYRRAATMEDLDGALILAGDLHDAAMLLAEAQQAAETRRGLLTQIGLIGSDLNGRLRAARAAFEHSDATQATAEAAAVLDALARANDAGRLRAFWGAGGLLVVVGIGLTRVFVARRTRRTR
jgi:hypothetical protein